MYIIPHLIDKLENQLAEIAALKAQLADVQARFDLAIKYSNDQEAELQKAEGAISELRKFSHSGSCRFVLTRGVKTCDCTKGIVDAYFAEREKP